MNLGFRIAWFRYQELKIFLFEYLIWKQRIVLWEGLAWVYRFDSRDLIARFLKFEEQLRANMKEFFWDKGLN